MLASQCSGKHVHIADTEQAGWLTYTSRGTCDQVGAWVGEMGGVRNCQGGSLQLRPGTLKRCLHLTDKALPLPCLSCCCGHPISGQSRWASICHTYLPGQFWESWGPEQGSGEDECQTLC